MKVAYKNTKRENKSFFGFIVMIAILVSATFIISAFQIPKQEKKYRLEVTLEQTNALISCLEQSQAPAVTVNAIIKLVAEQINPQLQAEQKKIQDSLDKSKPKPKQ
jgi:putative exporter of polyketide antibiotics